MTLPHQPHGLTDVGPEHPTKVYADLQSLVPPSSFPNSYPIIPGYEIVSLIGQGGMSNVYLARQGSLNRMVAIKMLRPQDSLDEHYRKRFLREASSIACLQHPNVVQIYEIGEAEGMLYLCLEYVPGGNLQTKIREKRPSPRESAEIVRQLAGAMQAAHKRSIIHRDLKPANILWDDREAGPAGESISGQPALDSRIAVKITDFGLVKFLSENNDLTQSGFIVGTPSYMAPEQTSGRSEDIGTASDIYSLGAILYELLSGEPPFRGDTGIEVMRRVCFEVPEPPSRLNREVPRDLERICLQCLEKRPQDRYASAEDLRADLSRFLRGFKVSAHRPPRLRKWLRQAREHPRRLLAVTLIGALTIMVLLLFWKLNRKEHIADVPQTIAPISVVPPEVQHALLRIRQNPKAEENVRLLAELGVDRLPQLAEEFPDDFAVQFGIGEAYALRQLSAQALAQFEFSRRLAEAQTARGEGGVQTWANSASAYERIGDLHATTMKVTATAIGDYDKSIALWEMLNQDDPRDRRWALELASLCRKQAELYAKDKQYVTAILMYDRRLGLLREHFMLDPQLGPAVRETHERMADLHRKLGNQRAVLLHEKAAREISIEK